MEKVRPLGLPQRGPNDNRNGKSQNIHSFVWFIFCFVKLIKPLKSLRLVAEPGEVKHYLWQRKNLGAHQAIRHTQGEGTSQGTAPSAEEDGQYCCKAAFCQQALKSQGDHRKFLMTGGRQNIMSASNRSKKDDAGTSKPHLTWKLSWSKTVLTQYPSI